MSTNKKFKVGNIVRCNIVIEGYLTKGKKYKIENIEGLNNEKIYIECDNNFIGWVDVGNFSCTCRHNCSECYDESNCPFFEEHIIKN